MKINQKRLFLFFYFAIILVLPFLIVNKMGNIITHASIVSQQSKQSNIVSDKIIFLVHDVDVNKESENSKIVETVAPPSYFIKIVENKITPESLLSLCTFIGDKYSISPTLLYAMCEKESSRSIYAVNGSCKGLMQISEVWHKDRMKVLGITDIYDPYGNVLLAADYISELKKETTNNMYYILMRYNMATKTANSLFAKGQISQYALEIVSRSQELDKQIVE